MHGTDSGDRVVNRTAHGGKVGSRPFAPWHHNRFTDRQRDARDAARDERALPPEAIGARHGHRGQVLPLYDLRALLGRGTSSSIRWWAMVRAAPLALAVEGFDVYTGWSA